MQGLNIAYATAVQELSTAYPALQASEYRPRSMKESVSLCLSEDSFNMLSDESAQMTIGADGAIDYVTFGEDEVGIFKLPEGVRYVALGIPKMFAIGKDDGKIDYLKRGEKLREANKVTITRVPLLMLMPDGGFVMDGDRPQIFTLKLKSSKTKLVGGDIRNPEYRSLKSLQTALCKHYKVRNSSLVHLVSVEIGVKPEKFTNGTDSSMGIMFTLEGNAKPLSEPQQKIVFDLLQDESIQELITDPFGLARDKDDASKDKPIVDNYDDVAF